MDAMSIPTHSYFGPVRSGQVCAALGVSENGVAGEENTNRIPHKFVRTTRVKQLQRGHISHISMTHTPTVPVPTIPSGNDEDVGPE